jgi:putative flippase GtrA
VPVQGELASGARGAGRWHATLRQWVRHHLVAIVATAADYIVMVACVELVRLRPVPAAALGAFVGAVTSFTLNRAFTYRASEATVAAYAWRYALVSGASLGWNAAGEYLFSNVLGLQYLLARFITSILVSNVWNYPLMRFFVFSAKPTGRA